MKARAWFWHLRPRSWPTVAGHALAGALMARGLDALSPSGSLYKTLSACAIWAILLNGGTLALNSAIDRDEGDVGFLNDPPPIPRGLGIYGLMLMLLGCLPAWWIGRPFLAVYAISVVLSILYSVPPVRLKARGGWDVLINMIGYGGLTALAGWLAASPLPIQGQWGIFAGFAFLFGAFYPMTQFYQKEEDERAGARTLALILGDQGSMLFIHGCLFAANLAWLWALWSRPTAPWAWTCYIAQALLWFVFALDWWRRFSRYPHQKGMYRALLLWALTNVLLIAAFWNRTS